MSNQRTKTKGGYVRRLQLAAMALLLAEAAITLATTAGQSSSALQCSAPQQGQSSSTSECPSTALLPRGKKLMLKDGTFQLVREYHVEGDRVRYYSIDQMGWEEIPEPLVDWDATRKMEIGDAKRNLDLIAEARKTDSARHAELLDVDASIEIAPKVFLPGGAGLFEF